ncbi:MAG: YciI family protein [Chloroflexi bacterium]|nr:YciI family protein [Chloroflexota bacterium]MCI0644235.1 YciI family protein [Chloroflexota bacterium]MCI0727554.1 YciI family protein [Chloroflexota bacterium]
MKYVFLAYRDEEQWNAMSAGERDALESACLANEQDLRQSGHLFAVEDLQSRNTTLTVQVVNGKVSLTGGSFAETKGQLVQLFIINARDLNEAIQVASKMPQARRGPIEVRPIIDLDKGEATAHPPR